MVDPNDLNIKLSKDELGILSGDLGKMMQKVMETVVLYGEALGAEKLVNIEGEGHFVIPWVLPWLAPPIKMLEELVDAGLKTKYPFTLDPCAPLDFENLNLDKSVEEKITVMFKDQEHYDQLLLALGLRDENAYTCNPYQPEIGNIPEPGVVLAWSESACAVYANSYLGARTNRNGAIMDLISNIAGKTPYTGLVTDEGRKAKWLIEIKTDTLPIPQILGAVIGKLVVADVPYIIGLDRFLSDLDESERSDYLHEMGAACATYGAVGLYHVENITPEAVAQGRDLLQKENKSVIVSNEDIQEELHSYPRLWTESETNPKQCYIGCPHLSYQQLTWWAEEFSKALKRENRKELAVETVLFSAPQILERIKRNEELYSKFKKAGVSFSPTCCETIYETGLLNGKPILTNSNKLRAYTSALYVQDDQLINTLVTGELPAEVNHD